MGDKLGSCFGDVIRGNKLFECGGVYEYGEV